MDAVSSHRRWQAARQAELAGPDSWLGLIGLIWLEEGENTVGSAPGCAVVLPDGPARLGSLRAEGTRLAWQAAADSGATVENGGAFADSCQARYEARYETRWQALHTDHSGSPSRIVVGSLVFFAIERDGRLAVRLRDRNWAAGRPVPGLQYFAYDPAWRVAAGWQQLATPLKMEVPNVSGELKAVGFTHRAIFDVAGQAVALLPVSVSENGIFSEIFFVFRDRTSGRQSYGGGRFLKARTTGGGALTLDFNFAYNPPCAFTPFATCPLPPAENWLPFAVPAGEKTPAGR